MRTIFDQVSEHASVSDRQGVFSGGLGTALYSEQPPAGGKTGDAETDWSAARSSGSVMEWGDEPGTVVDSTGAAARAARPAATAPARPAATTAPTPAEKAAAVLSFQPTVPGDASSITSWINPEGPVYRKPWFIGLAALSASVLAYSGYRYWKESK